MARAALLLVQIFILAESSAVTFTYDHGIDGIDIKSPLIIAHRGSSGTHPEHTIAAYEKGIQDGANVIECDIFLSRDLVPVCHHDLSLSPTTNVADLPQFATRNNTYTVGGKNYTGWFTLDFDLSELRTLRRRQKLMSRDQSHNDKYQIVTLEEYINVAQSADSVIGIYPELKYPAVHSAILQSRGVEQRFEDIVLEVLKGKGYTEASQPCFVQSFGEESLQYMHGKTNLPLVMLIDEDVTQEKLTEWGNLYYGVGCWKEQINRFWTADKGYKNYISEQTDFVRQAHSAGLKVHVYTFRNEDTYLAWDYGQDSSREYDDYLEQGVDGYFTDFPATLARKLSCTDDTTSGVDTAIARLTGIISYSLSLFFVAHLFSWW